MLPLHVLVAIHSSLSPGTPQEYQNCQQGRKLGKIDITLEALKTKNDRNSEIVQSGDLSIHTELYLDIPHSYTGFQDLLGF